MSNNSQNIRIAKNTLFLYMRMLLLLAISLYTSRVILDTLGIEDYGIYNLVAGFITFFSFLGNALISTMQRFFNTSLGQGNSERYQRVFSMGINTMLLFSLVIFFIGETIGFWFISNKLNIPLERHNASIIVYHFSLITFVVNMMRTPFHASIIAHEDMSFYAYLSIGEAILRLSIVFLLPLFAFDKLITYSILYTSIIVLTSFPYVYFCKRHYAECTYKFKPDFETFKELVSFSGWALVGQSSVVLKNQGEAFLVNRFFSVVANAAMGVSSQVTAAVDMFVTNFQMAFKPQIIQTFASNEMEAHRKLAMRASKFSFYLMVLIATPVIANLAYILNLWLVDVPEYTEQFVLYILISHLFNVLGYPFVSCIFASGKIKYYELSLASVFSLGLILSYVALKIGYPPYSIAIVAVIIQAILCLIRIYFAREYSKISIKIFLKDVIIPVCIICAISLIVIYMMRNIAVSFISLCLYSLVEVTIVSSSIYLFGISESERHSFNQYLLKLFHK